MRLGLAPPSASSLAARSMNCRVAEERRPRYLPTFASSAKTPPDNAATGQDLDSLPPVPPRRFFDVMREIMRARQTVEAPIWSVLDSRSWPEFKVRQRSSGADC